MTTLHLMIERERAIVITDTGTWRCRESGGADVMYWPDGEPVAVGKLFALTHIASVVAARGAGELGPWAFSECRACRDFDHAAERLAQRLPSLIATPMLSGTYNHEPLRHSVHLVGWSNKFNGMACASFNSGHGFKLEIAHPPEADSQRRYLMAPMRASDPRKYEPLPKSAQELVEYAIAAVRDEQALDAYAPYSGQLVMAEVRRNSMTLGQVGALPAAPRRVAANDVITDVDQLAQRHMEANSTYHAYESNPTLLSGVGYSQGTSVAGLSFTPKVDGLVEVSLSFDASGSVNFDAQRIAAGFVTPRSNMSDPGGAPANFVGWYFVNLASPTLQLSSNPAKVGTARTKCFLKFHAQVAGGTEYVAGIFTRNPVPSTSGLSFYDQGTIAVLSLYR